MSNIQKYEPKPLPKLDELYGDIEVSSKQNDLNRLLNQPPNPKWLKPHPTATKKVNGRDAPIDYLPIERVEFLLTTIFIEWSVDVKSVQTIANSVVVVVRLGVVNPITGQWQYNDGVGAAPINTKKGAAATDFGLVLHSSVQTAAPAAETYAIKDAAEKFGKIFGKDINRADEINYLQTLDSKFSKPATKEAIPDELKEVIAISDMENLTNIYKNNQEYHTNPEFMQLLTARKRELNANKNKQPA